MYFDCNSAVYFSTEHIPVLARMLRNGAKSETGGNTQIADALVSQVSALETGYLRQLTSKKDTDL